MVCLTLERRGEVVCSASEIEVGVIGSTLEMRGEGECLAQLVGER